jgi:hypothetical protein
MMLQRILWSGSILLGTATAAQAHAFGERYDLPVPLWMNLAGGGAVVVLSFVIAAWFMQPGAKENASPPTNLLAMPWFRALSNRWVLRAVRIFSVLLFVVALLAGYFGIPDYARNAAPTIVWVLGWVGLAFASVLLGNVWLLLNPWLILFQWADALWRRLTKRGLSRELPYLRRFGVLPGILMVIGFVWFMLASGQAGDSLSIAYMLACYSIITWTGMFLFGPIAWTTRAEAFTLLFGILARFSPTALRVADREACLQAGCPPDENGECIDCPEAFLRAPQDKRQITLRGFGAGLIVRHPLPLPMVILVLMVLALVAFEGFMDTPQWIDLMVSLGELQESDGIHAPLKTTLMFVLATALLFALFYIVSALMRRLGYGSAARKRSTLQIMGLFVLSLVPIAVAYHIAHYLYWFITQIQFVVPAASDPLAFGWNLFGGRDFVPDRAAVPLKVIWHTAVVAIVAGHVIAVYVAHRVALNEFGSRRAALLSQIPMLLLMVVYTMTSLWMLAQPIMG